MDNESDQIIDETVPERLSNVGDDPVGFMDDDPDIIEATCDLTAIYENHVYILIDEYMKSIDNPKPQTSWFGSPVKSSSNINLNILTGKGSVLIDSRK